MIIFGTKGRDDARGFIADECPNCREIRAFAVIDQYEVPHVYWVSMGKGSLRSTHMRCVHCSGTFSFDAHKYREIMTCAEAEHSNLPELVRRTHPQLASRLDRPPHSEFVPANSGQVVSATTRGPRSGTTYCQGCGYHRDRPFKFCPECGLARKGANPE